MPTRTRTPPPANGSAAYADGGGSAAGFRETLSPGYYSGPPQQACTLYICCQHAKPRVEKCFASSVKGTIITQASSF